VPATELGLVTQGSDAGTAENLSTLIISGNYIAFFFHFESFFERKLWNYLFCK